VAFHRAFVEGFDLPYSDDWEGSEHIPDGPDGIHTIRYRADVKQDEPVKDRGFKWRPSIHMPHWASRITLKVTNVRAEHIHDISESDAIAEGVETAHGFNDSLRYVSYPNPRDPDVSCLEPDAQTPFSFRWDALNEKRGYGWDANPWVWVLTFRLVGEEKAQKETGNAKQ
jgi:hypothetical protein